MRCPCQDQPLEHTASPDCWCRPREIEPGLWEHFQLLCPFCGGTGIAHCCEGERPDEASQ